MDLYKPEPFSCPYLEVIQSVLESIHGGSLHNVRSKTIPVVDYSLGEEVLSDIQSAWLFGLDCSLLGAIRNT